MENKITILKVVVGSVAHGLANKKSDIDYRGVYVLPTSEILKVGPHLKQTFWKEGDGDDETSWELQHFLFLATKSNPTILETFLAPIANPQDHQGFADGVRSLFPYVWSSLAVKNAFIGYGNNQRKKFLANQDNRAPKYAAAYLRTLYNAWELLTTGTFTVRIADTDVGPTVRRYKEGDFTVGEVIQTCLEWQEAVEMAYESSPKKETDLGPINDFLLRVRKEFW